MLVSCDLGHTWNTYEFPINGSGLYMIQNRDYLYVSNDTDVYQFEFNQEAWYNTNIDVNDLSTHALLCFDDDIVYLNDEQDYLWRYENCEWIQVSHLPFDIWGMTVISGNPDILCAGCVSSGDIYYSSDMGYSWELLEANYPEELAEYINYVECIYDPYRNLIWLDTNIGLMYMSVSDFYDLENPVNIESIYPQRLDIFPNPSNNIVTINYSIYNSERFKVEIYNLIGQNIITLFDGIKNKGRYSFMWNTDNIATGTYFVKITSSKSTQTKKVQIIK